jgi:hypothetical protein
MSFHPWGDFLKFASPRRWPPKPRTRCACRQPARTRLSLEALENRSLPSGTPLPIPGGVGTNPFGGPDIHFNFAGHADATGPAPVGGEPSTITDFNGFIGVAHVQGTGTDNHRNPLFWDADLRFMDGVFKGDDGGTHQGTFAFV